MGGDKNPDEAGEGIGRDSRGGLAPAVAIGVCAPIGLGVALLIVLGWWLAQPVATKDGPTCPGRLMGVCLAQMMYSQDWDDRFPPHRDWPDRLYPYLGRRKVYVCPQAPDIPVGYAYRHSLDARLVKSAGPPEKTIVFWDRERQTELPAFRHNGGLWVGYVDGHAKWLNQEPFLRGLGRRP
jgi:hypothetical protein